MKGPKSSISFINQLKLKEAERRAVEERRSANRGKTQLQFDLSNGDQDEESDFDGDVENDAPCLYCNEFYSQYKPEETWLQCKKCFSWAHNECATVSKRTTFFF